MPDFQRTPGSWFIIAAIALLTLAFVGAVVRFGVSVTVPAFLLWSVIAAALLYVGYRLTRSAGMLRAAKWVIPFGLASMVLSTVALNSENAWALAIMMAICFTLPLYIAYRALRRLYDSAAAPAPSSTSARGRELIAFAIVALVFGLLAFRNSRATMTTFVHQSYENVGQHAGCYSLTYGPWNPPLDRVEPMTTLVRLDTSMEAINGPSWDQFDNGTISLYWHRPRDFVHMSLRREGSVYRGSAMAGRVNVGASSSASVLASKSDCAAGQATRMVLRSPGSSVVFMAGKPN